MKIKVNLEKINPKYFDEIFYIKEKYRNNISKNPQQKPKSYLKEKVKWMILSLILIVISILEMYVSSTLLNLITYIVLLAIALIVFITNYVNYKAIKQIMKNTPDNSYNKIFEFNDKEVIYEEENIRKLTLAWDSLEMILINKYSIVFIPKDSNITWLSTAIDFKSEIIAAIEKYKKNILIVDNTSQEECYHYAKSNTKNKKIVSIILNIIIGTSLACAFLYVYNLEPKVVLKDNLTITQNDKVYNDSFVERIVHGEIISKREIVNTSSLGKKKIVLNVKNDFNKEFEFDFIIKIVDKSQE